eukprot:1178358-Prorocentrum_minimum.AAC.1
MLIFGYTDECTYLPQQHRPPGPALRCGWVTVTPGAEGVPAPSQFIGASLTGRVYVHQYPSGNFWPFYYDSPQIALSPSSYINWTAFSQQVQKSPHVSKFPPIELGIYQPLRHPPPSATSARVIWPAPAASAPASRRTPYATSPKRSSDSP